MNALLQSAEIDVLADEGAEFVTGKLGVDIDVDDLVYLGSDGAQICWSLSVDGDAFELVHRHRSRLFSLYLRNKGSRGAIVQRTDDLPVPARRRRASGAAQIPYRVRWAQEGRHRCITTFSLEYADRVYERLIAAHQRPVIWHGRTIVREGQTLPRGNTWKAGSEVA